MIQSHYGNLKLILQFIIHRVVAGNLRVLTFVVLMGVLGRALALIGFSMTLQAIVAAVRPEIFSGLLGRVLGQFDINLTFDRDQLILVFVVVILLIYATNWLLQIFRSHLLNGLISRRLKNRENFVKGGAMDHDTFMLEQFPTIVLSTEKSLNIIFFMVLIISVIFVLAPALVLLLLPILVLLILVQVLGDRKNLQEIKQQQDARRAYVNHVDPKDGKFRQRPAPVDGQERDDYLKILEKRRHQTIIRPQINNFFSAVALSIIIYYVFQMSLSLEKMAGLLIIFVVGLRYVISSSIELSNNLTKVLEIRKFLPIIERFMDNKRGQ